MPKLTINDQEIEVEDGLTIMQACTIAGIEIPHFCFHQRLKIAGNCRMCLVEMEKAPKPVASCSMMVGEGMVIYTNTPLVQKSREGVMEFLLINHPLDCPICDQGGECDLQDQAFKYGRGGNRYKENKRSVKDKNLGPLIKSHMTRCIHCTRCIRFCNDIAGVPEMGAIGRGEHMEVVSYLEKNLTSELSGNIIDLCPVGALTSKPYAFTARSWELEKTESIDVMDAVGSNIRIDSRGLEVMRILPKINEDINEEWLADKARFSYDGLKMQRLDRCYIKKDGRHLPVSWNEAVQLIAKQIKSVTGSELAAIAGTTANCESLFILKKLLKNLGSTNMSANQYGYKLDNSSRSNYLFNTTIAGIEEADLCLLIGTNLRGISPVLNARIGKMVRYGNLTVSRIGEVDDQTYDISELGNDVTIFEEIISGKHNFVRKLEAAKKPMVIVGDAVLARSDGAAILSLIHQIVAKYKIVTTTWNGFNILHNHAAMVGALDIGFHTNDIAGEIDNILHKTTENKIKVLYLLAADEINMSTIGKDCFVIYQGHHGDAGANRADIILPTSAYTEEDGIFVNLEGRPQFARRAVNPPGEALANWQAINNVFMEIASSFQGYNNLEELRQLMGKEITIFQHMDQVIATEFVRFTNDSKLLAGAINKIPLNYYMTDPISRASVTMAKCTKVRNNLQQKEVV